MQAYLPVFGSGPMQPGAFADRRPTYAFSFGFAVPPIGTRFAGPLLETSRS